MTEGAQGSPGATISPEPDQVPVRTPPLRKFFARIVLVDIQCPSCGGVFVCGSSRGAKGRKASKLWDTKYSIFTCIYCNRRWTLGVIAYPAPRGSRKSLPPDQAPTPEIANELRGQLADRRLRMWERANKVVKE